MRRMYSKEQLQKLIDEVSRLIAVEELDKVVPVPSLADAGKVIRVNSDGTGYVLSNGEPLLMENIEDEDGNKRFVDGDFNTRGTTGYTEIYGKWSLSGTHFMLVEVLKLDNGTSLDNYDVIGTASLPNYILNKIQPIGIGTWVSIEPFTLLDGNGVPTGDEINFLLTKELNGVKVWFIGEAYTATQDVYIRIQFDLLIDNA